MAIWINRAVGTIEGREVLCVFCNQIGDMRGHGRREDD